MADKFQGVLRASIQMALAFRSPMTAREIAAHLTRANPGRRFSASNVIAMLRSHPDLFVIERRRFFGLGPPRWRLHSAAGRSGRTPVIATPAAPERGAEPAPTVRAGPASSRPDELAVILEAPQDGLELIDDATAAAAGGTFVSPEKKALELERDKRSKERGPVPTPRPGQPNYRDVIAKNHPINDASDETLNILASRVHEDSD